MIMIDGGKPQIDFLSKLMKARHMNVPIVGISKFGGDKLVFEKGANDSFKKLAEGEKEILLAVRDEAHRFALKSSRRERRAPVRKGLKFKI
jgi:excinuclease UvrABC nuclease subunit